MQRIIGIKMRVRQRNVLNALQTKNIVTCIKKKIKMTASIILGMASGELIEPCDSSLPKKKIYDLYKKIKDENSLQFETASDVHQTLRDLKGKGERLVEICGAWEELCVASAVSQALELKLAVRIPKKFTFKYPYETFHNLQDNVYRFTKQKGIKYRFSETENYIFFFPRK